MSLPDPLVRLIEELQRLPGIGPKGAQRLAFHILKAPREQAEQLANALRDLKANVTVETNAVVRKATVKIVNPDGGRGTCACFAVVSG